MEFYGAVLGMNGRQIKDRMAAIVEFAELEKKMEDHRRELSGDIKDMPAQIIALLKNTDAI